eukprot:CAMPEP_0170481866 /NCGR_PEP_ID=MMETSP0208-20121228/2137_1 /TAXON_ID=197538 /ORGANISM="Strombidium inclinatum, Strain S3" /LENGTH=146 /DNA_ID=CAMNT_0010754645 /DNA_START=830 /DNA_END=1270 /DNA_ORIENTATION=-
MSFFLSCNSRLVLLIGGPPRYGSLVPMQHPGEGALLADHEAGVLLSAEVVEACPSDANETYRSVLFLTSDFKGRQEVSLSGLLQILGGRGAHLPDLNWNLNTWIGHGTRHNRLVWPQGQWANLLSSLTHEFGPNGVEVVSRVLLGG